MIYFDTNESEKNMPKIENREENRNQRRNQTK